MTTLLILDGNSEILGRVVRNYNLIWLWHLDTSTAVANLKRNLLPSNKSTMKMTNKFNIYNLHIINH